MFFNVAKTDTFQKQYSLNVRKQICLRGVQDKTKFLRALTGIYADKLVCNSMQCANIFDEIPVLQGSTHETLIHWNKNFNNRKT